MVIANATISRCPFDAYPLGTKHTKETSYLAKCDGETGWTYQHPNGMKCRAAKLGEDYTPQAIARTMAQQPQREPQQEQAQLRPTSYSVVVEEAQ